MLYLKMSLVLSVVLSTLLAGCASHASAPTMAESKVTAAVTTVGGDIGSARQSIAAATATLADVAALTGLPPGTAAMLVTLGSELSAADSPLARALSTDLPSVGAEADAAMALQEKRIEQAESAEHARFVMLSALGVGAGCGLIATVIVEGSMPGGTILLSVLIGFVVGSVAFGIVGLIEADVAKTIASEMKIVLWGGGAIVSALGAWWSYNRIKTGSWGGALHVALAPKPAP